MLKEFNLMCCNTIVGTFYIEDNIIGNRYRIKLIPKYLSSPCMFMFRGWHKNYIVGDSIVKHFLETRNYTKYNKVKVSKISFGKKKYNKYLAAKMSRCASPCDNIWVDFYGEKFEDIHPDYEIHLRKLDKVMMEDSLKE